MDEETLRALQHCPLFAGMTPVEVEQVAETIEHKELRLRRQDLYAISGDPCRHADIVIRGELSACMIGVTGRSLEVGRLRSGDLVAPAFIFAEDNRLPVSVEIAKETLLWRMSPEELQRLMDEQEQVRTNFLRLLSGMAAFLTRKMHVLSLLTVREKVAYFLLNAAKEQGSDTIVLSMSRQEIANSFGIRKYSLVRSLSELADAGAIRVRDKEITILSRAKLATLL